MEGSMEGSIVVVQVPVPAEATDLDVAVGRQEQVRRVQVEVHDQALVQLRDARGGRPIFDNFSAHADGERRGLDRVEG